MKKLLSVFATALLLNISTVWAADNTNTSLYPAECGSCHAPFPSRLLSANEWKKITRHLDKHFGVDATIDEATLKKINAYLTANSASKNRTTATGDKLPRITQSQWFIHQHGEVATKAWQRVQSPANCGGCHQNMNMRRAY